MDISELVKNPFVIGGIVIVVVILLFGSYFVSLYKQKNNYEDWTFEDKNDYNEYDIKELKNKTFDECMKECDDDSNCKAVVFDRTGITDDSITYEKMKKSKNTYNSCWIKSATENKTSVPNRISLVKPI